MKKKLLAILVSMLFLTTIPSVLGVNSESEDIEPCLDIGRYFTKGLVFNPPKSEPNTYFAIWLWYPTEGGMQLIILDWVTLIPSSYNGRFYEITIFGLFIYIIGFFEGGLEPLE